MEKNKSDGVLYLIIVTYVHKAILPAFLLSVPAAAFLSAATALAKAVAKVAA